MIPRLQAQETMDTAHAVALGTGSLKPDDQQRAWRALECAAADGAVHAPAANPAALAAIGIEVIYA